MYATSAATFSVSKQSCRTVEAVLGQSEKHVFLVGTQSLSGENHVEMLEYEEEGNLIKSVASFPHAGGITSLACHPTNPSLLLTTSLTNHGKLCRLDPSTQTLTDVSELPHRTEDRLRCMLWNPPDDEVSESETERFASVYDGMVVLWDLVSQRMDSIGEYTSRSDNCQTYGAVWNPHQLNEISMAVGTNIETIDLRSMQASRRVECAHRVAVRCVDYNPNKPYFMVTGGDDRRLKFWDVRKPDAPVKVVVAHSHWVTAAKYNRFHDQLVLSAGTDGAVSLFRLSSISSAPLLELDDEKEDGYEYSDASETADGLVKSFEDHNESVAGAAWSAGDAWVFATLSMDGSLVVNHVPSAEKYKILL